MKPIQSLHHTEICCMKDFFQTKCRQHRLCILMYSFKISYTVKKNTPTLYSVYLMTGTFWYYMLDGHMTYIFLCGNHLQLDHTDNPECVFFLCPYWETLHHVLNHFVPCITFIITIRLSKNSCSHAPNYIKSPFNELITA